jgi:uncharacterized protein YdhG (YjbR/CyaY superfamily)
VASRTALEKYSSELEEYDVSGTTIHFSAERPIPDTLIKKLVRIRIKENEAKAINKQLK